MKQIWSIGFSSIAKGGCATGHCLTSQSAASFAVATSSNEHRIACSGSAIRARSIVIQQKTGRPGVAESGEGPLDNFLRNILRSRWWCVLMPARALSPTASKTSQSFSQSCRVHARGGASDLSRWERLNRVFSQIDMLALRFRVEKINTIGGAYMGLYGGDRTSGAASRYCADFEIRALHTRRAWPDASERNARFRLESASTRAGGFGCHRPP